MNLIKFQNDCDLLGSRSRLSELCDFLQCKRAETKSSAYVKAEEGQALHLFRHENVIINGESFKTLKAAKTALDALVSIIARIRADMSKMETLAKISSEHFKKHAEPFIADRLKHAARFEDFVEQCQSLEIFEIRPTYVGKLNQKQTKEEK